MRIIVCLKAVSQTTLSIQISDAGDKIKCGDALVMNESEEYVLEEASALKKKCGGDLIAVTLGPLPAQSVLNKALAKDADRAIRVDAQFGDADRTSAALAEAIRKIGDYDLVLTGVESSDNLASEVGIRIAERLQLPYAYAVTGIEPESTSSSVKVTKEIGGGMRQVLELPMPALLCVQQGSTPLSYVPVKKMLQARTMAKESLSSEELGFIEEKDCKVKIVDVFRPTTRRAEIIEGEPPEIARKLLEIIRDQES